MLKKRSDGKYDMPDKDGFVDDGRDIPQRIYNVCAQMIHHVFSLHKVVKVNMYYVSQMTLIVTHSANNIL